jgi:hypothetical protein
LQFFYKFLGAEFLGAHALFGGVLVQKNRLKNNLPEFPLLRYFNGGGRGRFLTIASKTPIFIQWSIFSQYMANLQGQQKFFFRTAGNKASNLFPFWSGPGCFKKIKRALKKYRAFRCQQIARRSGRRQRLLFLNW